MGMQTWAAFRDEFSEGHLGGNKWGIMQRYKSEGKGVHRDDVGMEEAVWRAATATSQVGGAVQRSSEQ